MRAICVESFGGPEVLRLVDAPDLRPGPRQVLVRVRAAGVNPLEAVLRGGRAVGEYAPQPPYTPGYDVAGEVAAVGEDVSAFKVGDRVFGTPASGAYAELALAAVDSLGRLPDEISFEQGSAANTPYKTAVWSLLHLAQAQPGETVLVRGAVGAVGRAVVQVGRAAGHRIVSVVQSGQEEEALSLGAHAAVAAEAGDEQLARAIEEASGERGVDVVVELFARQNLAADLALLRPRGRVVIVGGPGPAELQIGPFINWGIAVMGVDLNHIAPATLRAIMARIAAGLEAGIYRPASPKCMPLEEAAEAHRLIEAGRAPGRLALIPSPPQADV